MEFRRKTAVFFIGMFILIMGSLVHGPASASAEEDTGPADWTSILQQLDTDEMDRFQQEVREELGIQNHFMTTREWLGNFVRGDWNLEGGSLWEQIKQCWFRMLRQNIHLLGKIIILSVISALLVQVENSLQAHTAKFAGIACHMSIALAAVLSFQQAWEMGSQAAGRMADFMNAMLPPMMVLTAGLGNVTSSAVMFPVLMTTTTAVADGIRVVVLPLAAFSIVLHIVNQLAEGIRVEKLAQFFSQAAQLSLGFIMTAFVGFITARTLYASTLDKVLLRTGKFVTDNTIPVVGKMLSDTLEVAAGYVMVLKNALGIYGVLILLGLLAVPFMQIVLLAVLYRLGAALVEPLGDEKTAALLDKIGGSIWFLAAALASVSLVFFMMIALIVGLTNNFTL